MKRIILYSAFMLLAATGCNKQLDIKPEGVFTEPQVVNSQATAEALLGDVYLKTYAASVTPTQGGIGHSIGDITTGITTLLGTSTSTALVNGTVRSNDPFVAALWNGHYAAINEANVLINLLPKENWNTSLQNTFIAEAKFARAFNYFQLLCLFGEKALNGGMDKMGVPIRLINFNGYDQSQNIPRNTNREVYAQILKDLDEAAAALTNTEVDAFKLRARAQTATCHALASRVALYMGDNDKAIAYSDLVLAVTAKYTLLSSPALVFPDNGAGAYLNLPFTNEWIWCFPVSYNKNTNSSSGDIAYHGVGYFYKTGIWPAPTFISSYGATDIRKNMFVMGNTPTVTTTGRLTPLKFSSGSGSVTPVRAPASTNQSRDNIVVLRLAEINLNKAEALVKKNGLTQTAVDLLNAIHVRAGLPAYTLAGFANADALLFAIIRERRWEFAFEGMDRYDQIRIGEKAGLPADLGIMNLNSSLTNPNFWALPIPSNDVVLTQGIIKQNPGY
jgi:hypothetical protein